MEETGSYLQLFLGLAALALIITAVRFIWKTGFRRAAEFETFSRIFKTDREPAGRVLKNQYGQIGYLKYKGYLKIIINENGIYFNTESRFAKFGSPLFIPWNRLSFKSSSSFLFEKYIQLEADCGDSSPKVEIELSEKVFTPLEIQRLKKISG